MGLVQLRVQSCPVEVLCSSLVQVCSCSRHNSASSGVRFGSSLPDGATPQHGSSEPAIAGQVCSFRHEAGVFAFDELINPYVAYLFKLVCRLTCWEGFIFNEYLNVWRCWAGCHGNQNLPLQPTDGSTLTIWMLWV